MTATTQFYADIDLLFNQMKQARLHNVSVDPTLTGNAGAVHFRSDTGFGYLWNGTAFDALNGSIVAAASATASGTVAPVTVALAAAGSNRKDQALTLSVPLATSSLAGSYPPGHFSLVGGATSAATNSQLVQRDSSGNFAANTITAALTGSATQLGGQDGTYYRARGNHTGFQVAATISDFDTQVRTSRLDQMTNPTSAVSFNGQRITSVATPTTGTDAANKQYVDDAINGMDWKASVRAASTANVAVASALVNGLVMDGVTLATGNRVLLKNQTTASENGLWTVASAGAAVRTLDADANAEVTSGLAVFIEEGTSNGNQQWVLTTDNPIVVGTTSLTFAQVGATGSAPIAGNGLTLASNQYDVGGTAGRISVGTDTIDIDATYVGQTSITTLGTVATGTWNATTIAIAKGGTGAITAPLARAALGATTKASATITGDGVTASFAFAHSLGTQDHIFMAFDATSGQVVVIPCIAGTNSDTLDFGTAPANGKTFRVIAVG